MKNGLVIIDGVEYELVPKKTGITEEMVNEFVKGSSNKELEIVAYRLQDEIWKKFDIDLFKTDNCDYPVWYEELLIKRGAEVYSVKRLSDNEVFSVGDETEKGRIKRFRIQRSSFNDKDVMVVVTELNGDFAASFEYLKKAKQPLIKTEDGKDVFEMDEFWAVWAKNEFSFWKWCADKDHDNRELFNECIKVFSTEAAAKEYIIHKKQTLSLDDILLCSYPYVTFNFNKEGKDYKILDEEKLRELVEKRINK